MTNQQDTPAEFPSRPSASTSTATAGPARPQPQIPMPVPAKPNHGKRALMVLGGLTLAAISAVAFFVLLIGAVVTGVVIGAAADADVVDISYTPATVDDIPDSVVADQADVVIDLTSLSPADFADQVTPFDLDVDVDFGRVEVIVPEGLNVDVNAETEVGSTEVFDRNNDGFDNKVNVAGGPDSDMNITVDVGFGEIEVERR